MIGSHDYVEGVGEVEKDFLWAEGRDMYYANHLNVTHSAEEAPNL